MSPGKAAAQAGHAYVGCLFSAPSHPLVQSYLNQPIGTKVCLRAPSLRELLQVWFAATRDGVPVFLVTDEGCLNFFEGRPVVTAIGVGPVSGPHSYLRKFRLLS
jgi:peptidyl-tRNA hydrolase